jgi:hypothetical protein
MSVNRILNEAHRVFLNYAQSHPGTLTLAMLGGTTLAGVVAVKIVENGESYTRDSQEKMSWEEARLIAMLENAKESSWTQNLENAVDAQGQFMVPNAEGEVPEFMSKIDQRCMEILKDQHAKIDKERGRKLTKTKYWN